MHHTTVATALLLTIPFLVDSHQLASTVDSDDCVHYSCVMFKGPTTEVKFTGRMDWKTYEKWFVKDAPFYSGERIEIPPTAEAIGVLVLRDNENRLLLMMPICKWDSTFPEPCFACQSESFGKPPVFGLITRFKTLPEYLKQLKRELSNLKAAD